MSEDGSVPCEQVIRVLKSMNTLKHVYKDGILTFYKDNNPEVILLPKNVPRRMLHRLAVKFDFDVVHFYHPEMASSGSRKANCKVN